MTQRFANQNGYKQCKECRGWYPVRWFNRNNVAKVRCTRKSYFRAVCPRCEQNKRDSKKVDNRWIVKARDAIRRHETKLGKLTEEFGWSVENLAHDFEHAYQNGCIDCRHPFKEMANGLSDLTIDIIDPKELPFYGTNTRILCKTCNRKKHRKAPADYQLDLYCQRLWEENQIQKERHVLFEASGQ